MPIAHEAQYKREYDKKFAIFSWETKWIGGVGYPWEPAYLCSLHLGLFKKYSTVGMLGESTIGAWFVNLFTGSNVILILLLSIQAEY